MVHPPTPHPASTRLRSRNHKEPRDTTVRETLSKTNASSASEQKSSNKPDDCLPGARKDKRINSSCPKPDINIVRENKSRISSRPSTPGVPSSKSVRIRTPGLIVRNGSAVVNSRTSSTSTSASKVSLLNGEKQSVSEKIQQPVSEKPCEKKSLHSAHYWLEQVKLAEQLEKHAVALGFFRLAVECDAEPMELLRDELIAYRKRYSLCSAGIRQVLISYGVPEESQEVLHSGKTEDNKERLIEKEQELEQDNEDVSNNISPENLGNMDVDSLTREVVTYIMSSMYDSEASPLVKSTSSLIDVQASSDKVQDENVVLLENERNGSEDLQEVADSEDESPTASNGACTNTSALCVGSMDADSLTREVVSCIMSSMYDLDNSSATKRTHLKPLKRKIMDTMQLSVKEAWLPMYIYESDIQRLRLTISSLKYGYYSTRNVTDLLAILTRYEVGEFAFISQPEHAKLKEFLLTSHGLNLCMSGNCFDNLVCEIMSQMQKFLKVQLGIM